MKSKLTFLVLTLSMSVYAQNTQLVARYSFEENLTNEVNSAQEGVADSQLAGTVPTFDADASRNGMVLHQYFGLPDDNSISYTQFPNPLRGIPDVNGLTVSIWVNRFDGNVFDGLWAFFDNADSRFYLTPNAYLSYNANNVFFDANWPETITTNVLAIEDWSMIVVTADASGFQIYVNGTQVFDKNNVEWFSNVASTSNEFDFSLIIDLVKSVPYFYLGFGSWWGSAELLLDDLRIYKGMLTSDEIYELYISERTTEIPQTEATAINSFYDQQSNSIIIDGLQGNEKIELFSIAGQLLLSGINQSVISAENLNKGVYLLKIDNGNIFTIKKLVIY